MPSHGPRCTLSEEWHEIASSHCCATAVTSRTTKSRNKSTRQAPTLRSVDPKLLERTLRSSAGKKERSPVDRIRMNKMDSTSLEFSEAIDDVQCLTHGHASPKVRTTHSRSRNSRTFDYTNTMDPFQSIFQFQFPSSYFLVLSLSSKTFISADIVTHTDRRTPLVVLQLEQKHVQLLLHP